MSGDERCPGSQMGPCGKTDPTSCGIRFCALEIARRKKVYGPSRRGAGE